MFDLNNSVCFRLLNYVGFDICGLMICGCSSAKSKPIKKNIPRIYFFTDLFGGSASVSAQADPQKRFCANCKRVLRAGGMRGLLELLLVNPIFEEYYVKIHAKKYF